MNTLFGFAILVGIMILGGDIALRGNPRIQRHYRRILHGVWARVRRAVQRFVAWAWRNYRQGIVGFGIGILTALYYIDHFQ